MVDKIGYYIILRDILSPLFEEASMNPIPVEKIILRRTIILRFFV